MISTDGDDKQSVGSLKFRPATDMSRVSANDSFNTSLHHILYGSKRQSNRPSLRLVSPFEKSQSVKNRSKSVTSNNNSNGNLQKREDLKQAMALKEYKEPIIR